MNVPLSTRLIIVRVFYVLLMLAGIGGLWLMAPQDASIVAGLIMTLVIYGPLLVFIPAVMQGDARQLTWLCFLLLFYFCGYVVQAFYPWPMNLLAAFRLAFLTGLFIAAMLVIRGQPTADR